MRVFISWSGERSKKIAEVLRTWIPGVIKAAKPYYTPDDITKGSRWSSEIAQVLDESKIGIICLTRENLNAQWIMFEAGALSKNIDRSKVVPVLFDVEPTDLEGPLVQFQAARFKKNEIEKIIKIINGELGDAKLTPEVLSSVFEMWWPKLDEQIKSIMKWSIESDSRTKRSDRDLLEEILMTVRLQAKGLPRSSIHPDAAKELAFSYAQLEEELNNVNVYPEVNNTLKKLFRPIRYILSRCVYEDRSRHELSEALEQVRTTLYEASASEEMIL